MTDQEAASGMALLATARSAVAQAAKKPDARHLAGPFNRLAGFVQGYLYVPRDEPAGGDQLDLDAMLQLILVISQLELMRLGTVAIQAVIKLFGAAANVFRHRMWTG